MRRARVLIVGLIAVASAGCGARPPQAPNDQASKIDSALSTMSSACGTATILLEYGGPNHAQLAKAEAQAAGAVPTLVSVLRRNPAWVYQSVTVEKIVSQAVSMLTDCGLPRAAHRLHAAAARARRS